MAKLNETAKLRQGVELHTWNSIFERKVKINTVDIRNAFDFQLNDTMSPMSFVGIFDMLGMILHISKGNE